MADARCGRQIGIAVLLVATLAGPGAAQGATAVDSAAGIGWKEIGWSTAALAMVAVTVDAPMARGFSGSTSPGTLRAARQFDRLGDATGLLPIVGGVAVVGLLSHQRALTRAALHAAEAVVLASVTVQAGKYLVGRQRPYADPDLDGLDFFHLSGSPAFPSGHTAAAFALATSLGDAIGTTWARIGLDALAAGTGWARMTEHAHWLSDVLGGAAIGVISAKFVAGRVRVFGHRAPQVIIGTRSAGLRLAF